MPGRKDWDPRSLYPQVQELQEFARETIGDGRRPNLFFVAVDGSIVLISQDFTVAYRAWKGFSTPPYQYETSLEDRMVGTLASVEPQFEDSPRLIRIDDTTMFGYR